MIRILRCSVLILSLLYISGCGEKKEKAIPSPIPIIDKTWAKDIEGGKTFYIEFNDGTFLLKKDGLAFLVSPDNYNLKTVMIKPILQKDKVKQLFDLILSQNPTYDFIGMQITFGYYDNLRVFQPLGAGIISNKITTPSQCDVCTFIDSLSEQITLDALITLTVKKNSSTFSIPKDQKIEIFLSGGLGIAPNFKALKSSINTFSVF